MVDGLADVATARRCQVRVLRRGRTARTTITRPDRPIWARPAPAALLCLLGSALVALVVTGQLMTRPVRQPAEMTPSQSSDGEAAGIPTPAGPPGRWVLGFHDEFNGTSLDVSRWRPNRQGATSIDPPFNKDSEAAAFSPQNVTVSDGALRLSVSKQSREVQGRWYPMTSGTISSQGNYTLRDGDYVEARVKIPQGDGLWPAFWAVTETSWPPEIDGFEFFDTSKQIRPRFNYHFPDGAQSGPSKYGHKGTDYRNSWHTYGWLREQGRLIPYVDGISYPDAGAFGADDRQYFIILNLSVFKGHHPRVDGDHAQMAVDWVRAWRPASP